MPRAILTTGLRCFSFRAQMRHCGLSSRKSSSGSSFLHPAHWRQPPIIAAHYKQTFSGDAKPTGACGARVAACRVACYDDIVAGVRSVWAATWRQISRP